MPITDADIQLRHSGGASNADGNKSLGGVMSSEELDQVLPLHNLFDLVLAEEAINGATNYRVIYLYNANNTLVSERTRLHFTTNWQTFMSMGVYTGNDPATVDINADVPAIPDEDTAPPNFTFTSPANLAAAINVGNLPGQHRVGVVLKRTITPGASAKNSAESDIEITLDTEE